MNSILDMEMGWTRGQNGQLYFHSGTGEISAYQIPTVVDDAKVGMRFSLRFLNCAPDRITFPIWGVMFLAPLVEVLDPHFALWVHGQQAVGKSWLVGTAMSHYGEQLYRSQALATFQDSSNRLMEMAQQVKDAPLVVEDCMQTLNPYFEYRALGMACREERLAMANNGRTEVFSVKPRGMLIFIGREKPTSRSLLTHLLPIEIRAGDVNAQKLTYLSDYITQLSQAMGGYLRWISNNWQEVIRVTQAWRSRHLDNALDLTNDYRLSKMGANLMTGIELGLRYAREIKAIDPGEHHKIYERGWNALFNQEEL